MTFRIGQKVACVSEFEARDEPWPQLGRIYTVEALTMGATEAGLRLVEVPTINPYGWKRSRFRPAVDRKTDISIFTNMLKKAVKTAIAVSKGTGA